MSLKNKIFDLIISLATARTRVLVPVRPLLRRTDKARKACLNLIHERMAKDKGCWKDGRSRKSQKGWTIEDVKSLWGGIQKEFKKKYYPKKSRRKGELSWNTPYNRMKNPEEA